MFLKIMSAENLADSDSRKQFDLHANIETVRFYRDDDDDLDVYARVKFTTGDMEERLRLPGNAYLMNAEGKTIATFGVAASPTARASYLPDSKHRI